MPYGVVKRHVLNRFMTNVATRFLSGSYATSVLVDIKFTFTLTVHPFAKPLALSVYHASMHHPP